MPLRRWIALLMLCLLAGSSVESVIGVLRDGEVHHENAGDARAHRLASADHVEHGHEDSSVPEEHRHGPDHQHGTAADHCTHHHGTPLIRSGFAFSLPFQGFRAVFPESRVHPAGPVFSSFRPPRA